MNLELFFAKHYSFNTSNGKEHVLSDLLTDRTQGAYRMLLEKNYTDINNPGVLLAEPCTLMFWIEVNFECLYPSRYLGIHIWGDILFTEHVFMLVQLFTLDFF